MTEIPSVPRGTILVIRTDGSEESLQREENVIEQVRRVIGAERLDFEVVLTCRETVRGFPVPELIMGVDDDGWAYRTEEIPGGLRNVPIAPKRPINAKATELYRQVCPAKYRDHQIVGDVVILHDGEGRR